MLERIRSGRNLKANLTSNFFDDPVLATSIQQLTDEEIRYETLRSSSTDQHPSVINLQRSLQRRKREVTKLIASAQQNLKYQREMLSRQIEELNSSLSGYPETQLTLARLTREAKVSESLYMLLLEKHKETEILQASTTTDKRIIDAASLPHKKRSPKRAKIILFGSIAGLLLGVAAAFAAHMLQRRIDTVEAIKELVQVPVYGTIPELAAASDTRQGRLSVARCGETPHEPTPGAFRALGVSVSLLPGERTGARIISITSSQPGRKSTVASISRKRSHARK